MDHSTLASAVAAHNHQAFLDPALAQEDIDAATAEIINASIRNAAQAHAAAAAEAEAEAQAAEAVVAEAVAEAALNSDSVIDPSLLDPEPEGDAEQLDEAAKPVAGPSTLPPQPNLHYPLVRPQRDDNTPYPEEHVFPTKAEFDVWMAAESSWCHYVQRRITNPEKRADERAKARDRAHERKLAGEVISKFPGGLRLIRIAMTPEEAAREPPLKKRNRSRTSAVVHKITYTCHHAGKYESQHNSDLPQERQRMNTKVSVKCGCMSRVVMNEMEDGEIKVAFWWKHNGHDPFADNEAETYRLPQPVNDWLVTQFNKGKEPHDILALLNVKEDVKAERIRRAEALAAGEPVADEDEDLPPIMAYGLNIKYPDLYNRYRKVGPPLRRKKAEAGGSGSGASTPLVEGAEKVATKKGRKRKVQQDDEDGDGLAAEEGPGNGKAGGAKASRPKRAKGKGKAAQAEEAGGEEVVLGDLMSDAEAAHEGQSGVEAGTDQQLYLAEEFNFADLDDSLHHLGGPSASIGPVDTASQVGHLPAGTSSDLLGSDMAMIDPSLSTPTSSLPVPHIEPSHADMLRAAVAATATARLLLDNSDGHGHAGGAHQGGGGEGEGAMLHGDAQGGMMDEEETTRMTEELEKLANEITSTWRH
ncbi:uncharacterized protein MKK02DRAFT_38596 [Dioszegia hungarica]|uniref:Uncharacterized protein n=1 Tax=Dioszegia hungarica TaxID=4972 RepID=A0AA38H7T2_9TREE|nr:uncharacterized protein MKK02DRAFT_38596 [Dioszegia hungarica]KAI9633924.1 hypothetical protein MKK02DRAFT_38596 [Dioszegia hungarica]